MWEDVFSSLRAEGDGATIDLSPFDRKTHGYTNVNYLTGEKVINRSISLLQVQLDNARKKSNSPSVIGLDCEWSVAPLVSSEEDKKVATLQLAWKDPNQPTDTGGKVFVIHLASLKRLPAVLTALLLDKNNLFVGVRIEQDIQKLRARFAHELPANQPISTRNLSHFAKDLSLFRRKDTSLANLSLVLLNSIVDKSNPARLSCWHLTPLTQQQIEYAADDAICSLLVYQELARISAGQERPFQKQQPVTLFDSSGFDVVAKGIIKDTVTPLVGRKRAPVFKVLIEDMAHVRLPSANAKFELQEGAVRQVSKKNQRAVSEVLESEGDSEKYIYWPAQQCRHDHAIYDNPYRMGPTVDKGTAAQNFVFLDSLHAMMRITRTLSKKHGAFFQFVRRFQGTCTPLVLD